MMIFLSVLAAFALDKLFGEPSRHHPLVYFGKWADFVEAQMNRKDAKRATGVFAYSIVVSPLLVCAVIVQIIANLNSVLFVLLSSVFLYIAIGWSSLLQHAKAIAEPLKAEQIPEAQKALSMIVSRETDELGETDIAKAATESVLENGADAIFSAVFWYCLLGIPGVVLYRVSNTLDAMWGYKTERFLSFGWFAARTDDVLNFIPARLTALTYALVGRFNLAMQYWKAQGRDWKSPNAGPVMSAGAGAINTSLGGAARYATGLQQRPVLGPEETVTTRATAQSIFDACALVDRGVYLWCAVIGVSFLI